jgi:hypothetical protein
MILRSHPILVEVLAVVAVLLAVVAAEVGRFYY